MVNLKQKLKDTFMLIEERDKELNKLSDSNHTHTENYQTEGNQFESMKIIKEKIRIPDRIEEE